MSRYFSESKRPSFSRRRLLQSVAASLAGVGMTQWMPALAKVEVERKRQCILLWMTGGPAQTDTFDMKSGHINGGPFEEIATSVPGLKFSQHLPRLAKTG